MKLFVYGTLRREGPMHQLLAPGARYLGPARFQGRLYDRGAFPALTRSRWRSDVVVGELFVLEDEPEKHLDVLDRYEGDAFRRAEVDVLFEDGTEKAWTYLYEGKLGDARHIESGDYIADQKPAGRV